MNNIINSSLQRKYVAPTKSRGRRKRKSVGVERWKEGESVLGGKQPWFRANTWAKKSMSVASARKEAISFFFPSSFSAASSSPLCWPNNPQEARQALWLTLLLFEEEEEEKKVELESKLKRFALADCQRFLKPFVSAVCSLPSWAHFIFTAFCGTWLRRTSRSKSNKSHEKCEKGSREKSTTLQATCRKLFKIIATC